MFLDGGMYFVRFLIAALAYFVFARLGSALAIPPDYAAAVWPAAGVALASFLLFSRTVAFTGVMAGAVWANLYTTTSALNELSATALISGIAMGLVQRCRGCSGLGFTALICQAAAVGMNCLTWFGSVSSSSRLAVWSAQRSVILRCTLMSLSSLNGWRLTGSPGGPATR